MTQEEIARRAGLSVRALRTIEQGSARPRESSVRRLAAALGLSTVERDELLAARGTRGAGSLWIGVLGPLSVRHGSADAGVRPKMQRELLGLLALRNGQRVSRDEIVEVLWGESPPHGSLNQVHVHVARLRALLEPQRRRGAPETVIVRSGVGYTLALDPNRLDLARFDELMSRARQARAERDPESEYRLLAEALDCWRGHVLADAGQRLRQHLVAVAVGRRRLDAVASFADAALALARYDQVVPVLREVVHEEPLHEGLHARLMLALAGSGEQAAALGVFADVRTRLAEELGVEPGAEIRAAHLRVLRQEIPASGQAMAPRSLGRAAR